MSVTTDTAADARRGRAGHRGTDRGRRARRDRRAVRRPTGVQRQGRRPHGVAHLHLAADVRRGPRRRGGPGRRRRRAGADGGDHGHQPDRAPGRRHGRDARGRGPDVDLQHALARPDRLHRWAGAARGGVRRDRRPPRAVAHHADRAGRHPRRRRHRRRPASTKPGSPRGTRSSPAVRPPPTTPSTRAPPRSPRTASRRSSTRRAPPATPRASSSATATCSSTARPGCGSSAWSAPS